MKQNPNRKVYILGDVIDRGEDSFLILSVLPFINGKPMFLFTSISPGHLSPPKSAFKLDKDGNPVDLVKHQN